MVSFAVLSGEAMLDTTAGENEDTSKTPFFLSNMEIPLALFTSPLEEPFTEPVTEEETTEEFIDEEGSTSPLPEEDFELMAEPDPIVFADTQPTLPVPLATSATEASQPTEPTVLEVMENSQVSFLAEAITVVVPDETLVTDPMEEFIAGVIELSNAERSKYGLVTLERFTLADAAAAVRASEIKELFSHYRPNGELCFTVFEEVGLQCLAGGENIAYGQFSATEVVKAWMDSEGHRNNMLNSKYSRIGVSVSRRDDGCLFWVQILID